MTSLRPISATNKSIDRIKRSVRQNIKIIENDKNKYTICGNTGSLYTVNVCDPKITCTCMDYKLRKNYCKHIYFIFVNVFKIVPDISKEYTIDELVKLHESFIDHVIDSPRNDECCICFEPLTKPVVCGTCSNGFHQTCINSMVQVSKKHNCPLCRSSMISSDIAEITNRINLL
jgi:hypothetical protein